MTTTLKTLSSTIDYGSQTVTLLELLRLRLNGVEHKLLLRVASDAYKAQGTAIVRRWDGTQWNLVWSIPAESMKTEKGLCYLPRAATRIAFAEDANELIARAKEILG